MNPEIENHDLEEPGKDTNQAVQNVEPNASTLNSPLSKEQAMEVHHHPDLHHKKKNLREYFIEFLMIFLAVTLGFIAENIRENISDSRREKEFAKELYAELKEDSVEASRIISMRIAKEKEMDYLAGYFQDSSLTALPKKFYPSFTICLSIIQRYLFEPRDGILNQLHSTGAMRYFKSVALQKMLGDLSVVLNGIRIRNESESEYSANTLRQFMLEHYDYRWIDQLRMHDSDPSIFKVINRYMESSIWYKASLLHVSSIDRSSACNMILNYKQIIHGTRIVGMADYLKINHAILDELRKDYPGVYQFPRSREQLIEEQT